MKRTPHADDFFSQKDADFFYQREFRHEFRRVYAHAALVLAVWDDYTRLAAASLRCVLLRTLRRLRETIKTVFSRVIGLMLLSIDDTDDTDISIDFLVGGGKGRMLRNLSHLYFRDNIRKHVASALVI